MKPFEIARVQIETPRWYLEGDYTGKAWNDLSQQVDPRTALEMIYVATRSSALWNMGTPLSRWRSLIGGDFKAEVSIVKPIDLQVSFHSREGSYLIRPTSSDKDPLFDLKATDQVFSSAYASHRSLKSMRGDLMEDRSLDIPARGSGLPALNKSLEKIVKYLLKDVEHFNLWGMLNPHDKVHILSYLTRIQNPETRVHITWLNPYEDNLLAWVVDLFIQYARMTGQVPDPATMSGIVVLEQFDLHCISPEGSYHLRDQILKTFPKMQFFVTSRFGNEISSDS